MNSNSPTYLYEDDRDIANDGNEWSEAIKDN